MKLKGLFHTLSLMMNAPLLGRVVRHFEKPAGKTQEGSKKSNGHSSHLPLSKDIANIYWKSRREEFFFGICSFHSSWQWVFCDVLKSVQVWEGQEGFWSQSFKWPRSPLLCIQNRLQWTQEPVSSPTLDFQVFDGRCTSGTQLHFGQQTGIYSLPALTILVWCHTIKF